ncbi:MAG: hypothetical protein OYL92_15775 [Acidobacteriota bacterium]|nr:hypothetical protein [Acidobacteriota bacterium]MDE3266427.1 hypothetical protein [Acidobacteriota bacterium]
MAEIPEDFEGAMRVPITFLDKYNRSSSRSWGWTAR